MRTIFRPICWIIGHTMNYIGFYQKECDLCGLIVRGNYFDEINHIGHVTAVKYARNPICTNPECDPRTHIVGTLWCLDYQGELDTEE